MAPALTGRAQSWCRDPVSSFRGHHVIAGRPESGSRGCVTDHQRGPHREASADCEAINILHGPGAIPLFLSLPDRIFGLALRIPSGRSRRFGMSRKSNGRKEGSKITFQRECLQTGRPTRQVVWCACRVRRASRTTPAAHCDGERLRQAAAS